MARPTQDVVVPIDPDLKPTLSHDEKFEVAEPQTETQLWLASLSDEEFDLEQKKLLRKVRSGA